MLILTTLTTGGKFPTEICRRFVGSLAATGFDGKVVMFTTVDEIRKANLLDLEREFECLTFCALPKAVQKPDINCLRYLYFYDYLMTHAEEHDLVMLSDSRDVIFQRDISRYPFSSHADLHVAEEEKLIGDCAINAGWIQNLYGEDCLSNLKDRTVLCSGTTIGSPQAMLLYLDAMTEQIAVHRKAYYQKYGHAGGLDQGIHNYLFYKSSLSDLNIERVSNSEDMIYTIGHVAIDDPNRVFFDHAGRFINLNKQLPYCIHQFDRLDQRTRQIFNKNAPYPI
jgi:hypothetical protein